MDLDPPPKPPDPGGSGGSSGRKRQNVETSSDDPVNKRTIIDPSTTNPSNQIIYVHPSFSEGPKNYNNEDTGPFIVHVSRAVVDPSAGTSIRAIKFGQFLHTHKISSIINDGVKNIGRNRISVEFSNGQAANEFLANPILDLSKYKAIIPTYNVTRMGLARGVPVDWSMDELIDSLVLPSGCGVVLKARRLSRKVINEGTVTWIPTQSVVLTFAGQLLPSKIYSFHTSLPIETYKLPTIMCLNCCRYGHVKTQCRSQPRCFKCSQSHTGESCSVVKDNSTCLYCSGKHFATDKECPEFSRQQSIKLVMSSENISYLEASLRFPPSRKSYSEVAKEMFSPPTFSPSSPHKTNSKSNPSYQSYRQTVFRAPRPRSPLGKGYDVHAHQAITATCPSSTPNGCALNNNVQPTLPSADPNLLLSITQILLSIISTGNEIPLPHDVAQNLFSIFNILRNGPNQFPSVEL